MLSYGKKKWESKQEIQSINTIRTLYSSGSHSNGGIQGFNQIRNNFLV